MAITLSGAALEKAVSDAYWWAGGFLVLLIVLAVLSVVWGDAHTDD